MNIAQKLEMFNLLVELGFKEIEVGFPAASQVEHDFTRLLIEEGLIPDDVSIQVLTQAREGLIRKTFEALQGAKKAIVHLYNSTSTLQRDVVFQMNQQDIIALGVQGAKVIREEARRFDGEIFYEYSPESFTGTELDFSLEICEAVLQVWEPSPEKPVILNLPATVEMSTPNIYADRIEWFIRQLKHRNSTRISLHAHNDRGCAVAATELALLAGADRVEGTLFGNGERTGNVDLLTLALNMFTQGVNPNLDFSNINRVAEVYSRCTGLPVHPRHPYVGELVYTAFSGSHQDAISKGMEAAAQAPSGIWAVPYLPIDPKDVGRSYESIICINSQSGKGGAAYVMNQEFGYKLPKKMRPGFGRLVQEETERRGSALPAKAVFGVFEREYLQQNHRAGAIRLKQFNVLKRHIDDDERTSAADIEAVVERGGQELGLQGSGNGVLDAFATALKVGTQLDFTLTSYHEHALTEGTSAKAVTYIEILDPRPQGTEEAWWGAGVDTDIIVSSIKALLSALNRMQAGR
jgi:2-isopropylmalate synthase